ncbi:uncharacterized protein LAESUDRAFT_729615 [Laetiporus sulphureus 93-53]|uniref:Uncharacterized protein n=1 Tax=Laetiporus sulphureus 93-53 TaxID=1314785 RepID=A0A165CMV5_9APHY|nr:uncharacterized protein LAESUDRAFT_729615 [Laetiporus sulphureus 93-53]KZT03100.1 hypothetical protein LAESUDRAFT_729615 [Laetiporus sulphureus 93-53]
MPMRSEANPGLLATAPCFLPSSRSSAYQFEVWLYRTPPATTIGTCSSSRDCSDELLPAFLTFSALLLIQPPPSSVSLIQRLPSCRSIYGHRTHCRQGGNGHILRWIRLLR